LKYPTSVVIADVEVIEILLAVGGTKFEAEPRLLTLERTIKQPLDCACPSKAALLRN